MRLRGHNWEIYNRVVTYFTFRANSAPDNPRVPRRQIPPGSPLPTHAKTRETSKQQA